MDKSQKVQNLGLVDNWSNPQVHITDLEISEADNSYRVLSISDSSIYPAAGEKEKKKKLWEFSKPQGKETVQCLSLKKENWILPLFQFNMFILGKIYYTVELKLDKIMYALHKTVLFSSRKLERVGFFLLLFLLMRTILYVQNLVLVWFVVWFHLFFF